MLISAFVGRIVLDMENTHVTALAYLRTSSAANVGEDSDARQRTAIANYAKAHGIGIVGEFYDAAVSGTDPVETRPGFSAMLDRIEGNGVRLVIVEDASRFARDLVAHELGVLVMQQRGVRVVTAGGDDLTDTTDPTRIMMRQIAGAFAQYEKAWLVGKLRAARERKAALTGKPAVGRTHDADRLATLQELWKADPTATYAQLSERLAARGFLTLPPKRQGAAQYGGKPISVQQISRMVKPLARQTAAD
jgi:DNA invertase Pin-like site-specific DNA recombinase